MAEINLTAENFEEEVLKSEVPVLVDFWATWCGPCQMMAPVVEEMAEECGAAAKICKLNVDQNMAIAQEYGIISIPCFLIFKDGKIVNKHVGVTAKETLMGLLGL